jgi:hypothetical protein
VVDDYDLLEGQPSPLRPLFPYVPTGREVGFHVVVGAPVRWHLPGAAE